MYEGSRSFYSASTSEPIALTSCSLSMNEVCETPECAVDPKDEGEGPKKDRVSTKSANVAPTKDAEQQQAVTEISPAKTRSGKTITRTGKRKMLPWRCKFPCSTRITSESSQVFELNQGRDLALIQQVLLQFNYAYASPIVMN